MGRARRRNLVVAGAGAAAVIFAGYDLWIWLSSYLGDNFHNDFTFYYAAARLGLAHGWGHLYDLKLQQGQLDAIGSRITVAQLARFVSPPPLAWLVVPLALLPYRVAYWVWSGILLAALALAWQLAAPGRARSRVIFLVAAIGWLPVIYGLQLGQPALLVAAGVAASYALLRRNADWAAGAVLGVLVLKPQLALLVPAALLVTGRWRAFIASAVVLGALAIASAIALGPHGISDYQGILTFATTVPQNQSQTLAAWIHNLEATRVVQALIAVWALALAYRVRRRGVETVFAIVLVGGLVASPYVHYDDLTMLGLAILLFMRGPCPRGTYAYVAALVVAAEGFPLWGAGPVLAGELGALAVLSVSAFKHGDGVAEHEQAEGEHHPDLELDRQHVAADGQGELIDHGSGPA
jgi:glycosyl transferase family 87